ncbi:hypothetical protein [Pseudomonas sp. SWRI99]|uniref:hypothetical protein n=1 Tax=Pseudomonas sp. SWRI99 TaxID=2745506 RepID=UPI00164639A3|nr:hypothetical protein [Pseudomonas sp. SWRI99]MBC3775441.1 hypothetical protein [Pseudomonas sp. SWRI99]
MLSNIRQRRNAIGSGMCKGTINTVEQFNAGLVELYEDTFDPPHGEAYVMFARQRNMDSTTKEIVLSFSKSLPNDSYVLTPTSHQVRVTFLDTSDPARFVTYTQRSGTAIITYDRDSAILSGNLNNVVVENNDDDELKLLTLEVALAAAGDIVKLRRYLSIAA